MLVDQILRLLLAQVSSEVYLYIKLRDTRRVPPVLPIDNDLETIILDALLPKIVLDVHTVAHPQDCHNQVARADADVGAVGVDSSGDDLNAPMFSLEQASLDLRNLLKFQSHLLRGNICLIAGTPS